MGRSSSFSCRENHILTKSIDVLMFHPSDLEYQLDTIVDFLSLTHPFLLDPTKNATCVELRPILRKGKDYKLSKSLALWNLDELEVNLVVI